MKDFFEFLPTARRSMRGLAAGTLHLSRRGLALGIVGLMLPLGVGSLSAFAQQAPPPPPPPDQSQTAPDQSQAQPGDDQAPPPPDQAPPQQWSALSTDQLNQLVAPLALYPDSLVAQVLAAATYPTQVTDADRFVHANQGVAPDQLAQMANSQPWDPSVKALCAFPSVLDNLNKNIDWTTQLGNAYYNQPQDVMSAVQTDRQQAYNSGKLRSTPQETVTYAPGDVVIAPANPAVVYVPYYDPWAVWGWGRPWFAWYAPPPPPGFFMGVGIGWGFGFGIAVRPWGGWGWGWGHWGMGWGPHPWVAYNHVTYVSRSVTVINHGYYGRFDRNPGARSWNYHAAVTAHTAWHNNGYNAGARAGYNGGYNRGGVGARPGQTFNRQGGQNFNRPAQNVGRPGQTTGRPGLNTGRPAQTFSHPAANTGRPAPTNRGASRPAPQGHPAGGGGAGHPAPHGNGGGKPHSR